MCFPGSAAAKRSFQPGFPRGVERSLTENGAADVVGDVAAADDDDPFAERRRVAEAQVAQELDTSEDAGSVGAGNREFP